MKNRINNISKKITIVFCLLSLFNFIIPTYSNASLNETLINPVKDLILLIADGAMGIMQGFTMGDYFVTQPSEEADKTGEIFTVLARGINSLTFGAISNIDELNDIATIKYTPYLIFTNQIPTFDANFFNNIDTSKSWLKSDDNVISKNTISGETTQNAKSAIKNISDGNYTDAHALLTDIDSLIRFSKEADGDNNDDLKLLANSKSFINEYIVATTNKTEEKQFCEKYGLASLPPLSDLVNLFKPTEKSLTSNGFNTLEIEILKNLPSGVTKKIQTALSNDSVVIHSTAFTLAPTISKWYSTLSVVAIVSMMSVLVYSGIRIIISSASKDKAKYKQMIVDWFVAVCLLFFMRYIMSFSFAFVDKILSLLSNINSGTTEFFNNSRNIAGIQSNGWLALGYTIIYIILVCITIYFTFVYLKRVLYLAFLTIISPLVAFTYPIDKISDGKAQAFNMWLKEYLFNLLIQPLHLVLYSVLIGTASNLVSSNYIYAVVALGFMTQAEKLIRKFFGFEKAQTPGFLNGPAGGALMMEGFKKLTGWGPGSHNKSKGSSDSSSSGADKDKGKIKTKSVDAYGTMIGNSDSDNSTTNNSESENTNSGFIPSGTNTESTYNFPEYENPNLAGYTYSTNGSTELPVGNDFSYFSPSFDTPQYSFAGNSSNSSNSSPNSNDSNSGFVPSGSNTVSTYNFPDSSRLSPNAQIPRNTVSNSTSTNKKPKRKIKNNLGKGILSGLGAYGRGTWKKLTAPKSGNNVLKSALKFGAGVGMGALGLGIGIATGDPKQALQNTIVGAKAGSNLTNNAFNLVDGVGDALHIDGVKEAFESGYYGDDYKEHLQEEQYKEWLKQNEEQLIRNLGLKKYRELRKNETLEKYKDAGLSKEEIITKIGEEKYKELDNDQLEEYKNAGLSREEIIEKEGKDEYKELKKRERLKEYFSAGINDIGEIVAGEKFKESNHEFDTDGAISAIKIANQIGDYENMSAKSQKEANETLRKNFKAKNKNLSEKQLDKLVENQINYINEINSNKNIV